MFVIAACRRCQINRNAVYCLTALRNREIKNESVLTQNRKINSRGVLHEILLNKRGSCEMIKLDKLNTNLVYSRFMLQKKMFCTFVDTINRDYGGHILFFMQSRNISSAENTEKKESILTIPNFLCLTRIALTPVMAYLVMQSHHSAALILLGLAGATDMLDGFIARNFSNQSSVFGSMLDPLADKILMTTMTITLAYANLLPASLCLLIVGRDIGIVTAVAYLRFKTVPKPLTASKFFDVNLPTVQMKPTFISKINTGLQLALVGLCMAAPVFDFIGNYWLQLYWYLVGSTTVVSGMSYVVKGNRTFRVVK